MTFEELNLHPDLLEAISWMNFVNATPIQERAIPAILDNKDLLACAQTGTGKTGAFLLPILHKLAEVEKEVTDTLIVVPTRELALQIDKQIQAFTYYLPVKSAAVYGGGDGKDFAFQRQALTNGTQIIVATPGKLISHLRLGYVKFENIGHLILDEADRMLDMGFAEDIEKIISYLPEKRQNLLFSATMPPKIRKLAKIMLTDPVEITLELSKPAEGVLQAAYLAHPDQKTRLVSSLISGKDYCESILIFCSTKRKVHDIMHALKNSEYKVEAISSDLEQTERESVLSRFRAKQTKVLVATDVISRGIDIKDINLVINFDVPQDAEDYVHRIGRTARAGRTGIALTLVSSSDMGRFARIEQLIGKEVNKLSLPPELGEGPVWKSRSRGGSSRNGGGSYNKKPSRGRGKGRPSSNRKRSSN